MKFRPLHDRIVVKRIEAEEKTAGGIIIPDTVKEKPSQGEVVAVGPGGRDEAGKLIPIDIRAGDRVLFGKWSGTEVKIDGEDSPDHEGERYLRRDRRRRSQEKGRLSTTILSSPARCQTRCRHGRGYEFIGSFLAARTSDPLHAPATAGLRE